MNRSTIILDASVETTMAVQADARRTTRAATRTHPTLARAMQPMGARLKAPAENSRAVALGAGDVLPKAVEARRTTTRRTAGAAAKEAPGGAAH